MHTASMLPLLSIILDPCLPAAVWVQLEAAAWRQRGGEKKWQYRCSLKLPSPSATPCWLEAEPTSRRKGRKNKVVVAALVQLPAVCLSVGVGKALPMMHHQSHLACIKLELGCSSPWLIKSCLPLANNIHIDFLKAVMSCQCL